jgi:serine/threonine-protein kinase
LRGLAREPAERFASARDMARAIERALPLAPTSDVGEFVEKIAGPALAQRAERIAKIESSSHALKVPTPSVGAMRASDASWPSLVVPGPVRPSATTQVDTVAPHASAAPLPPLERSISATVSDSLHRVAAERDQEPTFLRLRKRALRRVVVSISAVAGAILLVAGGVVLRSHRMPTTAAQTTAAPAILPPSPPPVSATALPAPSASPPETATVAPASTEAPANRAAAPRPVPHRAAAPAAAAGGAPSCDPPYTIDANGFRRYKRECLR